MKGEKKEFTMTHRYLIKRKKRSVINVHIEKYSKRKNTEKVSFEDTEFEETLKHSDDEH